MTIHDYKYETGEVEGVNCSVVEKNTTKERAYFLKHLLQLNGYEVKLEEKMPATPAEAEPPEYPKAFYSVGVTDIRFNPVMEIFKRKIITPEGTVALPLYWDEAHLNEEWYWKEKTPLKEITEKIPLNTALNIPNPIS